MALRYSLYMGILCVGLFTRFGPALGETFYHNADAGRFIQILSWLCPFLYLSTTMGSILNGLGKTGTVFVHHTVSMLLTLSLVLSPSRDGGFSPIWRRFSSANWCSPFSTSMPSPAKSPSVCQSARAL
ncbi:MAG: hypothetical protein ACLTR6_03820 [Clostridium fessum]